jgi:hypothetical protein
MSENTRNSIKKFFDKFKQIISKHGIYSLEPHEAGYKIIHKNESMENIGTFCYCTNSSSFEDDCNIPIAGLSHDELIKVINYYFALNGNENAKNIIIAESKVAIKKIVEAHFENKKIDKLHYINNFSEGKTAKFVLNFDSVNGTESLSLKCGESSDSVCNFLFVSDLKKEVDNVIDSLISERKEKLKKYFKNFSWFFKKNESDFTVREDGNRFEIISSKGEIVHRSTQSGSIFGDQDSIQMYNISDLYNIEEYKNVFELFLLETSGRKPDLKKYFSIHEKYWKSWDPTEKLSIVANNNSYDILNSNNHCMHSSAQYEFNSELNILDITSKFSLQEYTDHFNEYIKEINPEYYKNHIESNSSEKNIEMQNTNDIYIWLSYWKPYFASNKFRLFKTQNNNGVYEIVRLDDYSFNNVVLSSKLTNAYYSRIISDNHTFEEFDFEFRNFIDSINDRPLLKNRADSLIKYMTSHVTWMLNSYSKDSHFSIHNDNLVMHYHKDNSTYTFSIPFLDFKDLELDEIKICMDLVKTNLDSKHGRKYEEQSKSVKTPSKAIENKPVKIKKKENKMTTKKLNVSNFVNMMKKDAVAGGQAALANQITSATKAGMLKLMKDRGSDDSALASIASMLNSEAGTAFIHLFLGIGMEYVPVLSNDPRVKMLAPKFREKGFEVAGTAGIDVMMNTFAPIIMGALNSVPEMMEKKEVKKLAEKKVRVPSSKKKKNDDLDVDDLSSDEMEAVIAESKELQKKAL